VSENPKTLRIRNPAASLRARQALGRVRGSRLVSNGKLLHNPWMGPSQWPGPPVDGSRFRQSRNRRGFFGLQHWIWRVATRGLDVNERWGQTPSVRAVMEEAKARHVIHQRAGISISFQIPAGFPGLLFLPPLSRAPCSSFHIMPFFGSSLLFA
jgi:hypothetical protein